VVPGVIDILCDVKDAPQERGVAATAWKIVESGKTSPLASLFGFCGRAPRAKPGSSVLFFVVVTPKNSKFFPSSYTLCLRFHAMNHNIFRYSI
jgi:hypothetical protein